MRVHEAQHVPILGSSIGCQGVSKLSRRMTRGSSVVLRVARMSSGRLSVSSREDTWKDGQGRCWVSLRWYKAPRIGAPLKISSSLTDVSWPLDLPHTPWSQNKHMGASYITANKMINNLVDHRIMAGGTGISAHEAITALRSTRVIIAFKTSFHVLHLVPDVVYLLYHCQRNSIDICKLRLKTR